MNFGILGVCSLAVASTLAFSPIVEIKADQQVSQIVNIQSLSEVHVSQPDKTLFLLDLDDTIFDFPHMVGSKSWRSYIRQATIEIDDSRNWHDILSYYLTKNYPVKTVEPMTSEFVQNLQEKGYVVCGFTSRERKLWYDMPQEGVDLMTTSQLNSVGINFNNNSLENTYPYLALEPEYFSGTYFCNIEPKGNFLTHLFKDAPAVPSKVVFIDDKLSQVESVSNALTTLGIPHESYCYLATNAKAKNFDPLIANIQLYHYLKSNEVLSDDEAALLAKENPSNNADFYLRAILEIASLI
jgi:hypothetical protein